MIRLLHHLDDYTQARLRTYLASAPKETGVCGEHDPRWLRVLEQGLGHRPYALLAEGDQGLVGYLPLALVRSALFGRFLVSLPYLNRAGLVTSNDQVASDLLDAAIKLAERHDAQYLELRHHQRTVVGDGITHEKNDKVRMVLNLPDNEASLRQAIGAKVRNQIKKGDKFDLQLQWGGLDLLERFYKVFAVNMRDLGTPVYPRKLFRAILEQFADEAELAVVLQADQPVAVALLVHQAGETQVPSASSLRAFNHTNANMWMYYRLLLRAIERGCTSFDFGRSTPGTPGTPDGGTYRFKKQWGAQPHPTTWQYHLRHGDLNAMRPDDPKMQKRIATWQKLPVWVTRIVGPTIVRGIP